MLNRTHLINLCAAILLGSTAALSTPAFAVNEAMLDLLKILVDKGSLTQGEYKLLVNAAKADGEKVEGTVNEMKAEVEKKTKGLPEFGLDKGKLEFKSANGEHKFRVGGRLQADVQQNGNDVNAGDLETEFRRARFYLSGTFSKFWDYKLQYTFSDDTGGNGSIEDAYIAYTGFEPTTITFGHSKVPFSLEELTSSKYITFIERSAFVNAQAPGRRFGVIANSSFNDMFTVAAALHADGASDSDVDAEKGITARLTFSPIHEGDKFAHLGFSFDHSTSDNASNFDRVRARPEVHLGSRAIDTGNNVDAEERTSYAIEASGGYGPFSLQAEYSHQTLSERLLNAPDLDLQGFYVYGSYYLTGESRNYKWEEGSFSQTKVKNPVGKGGYGAWEVAARYASGDYDTTTLGISSEADAVTLGLNWYPNNNVRFALNYINVLDTKNDTLALAPGATGDDADFLLFRSQWYF